MREVKRIQKTVDYEDRIIDQEYNRLVKWADSIVYNLYRYFIGTYFVRLKEAQRKKRKKKKSI